MNFLSICDGISCCKEAADKAGIMVDEYYAVEINAKARETSDLNHDGITRPCDDAYNVTAKNVLYEWPKFDVFAAGTTCSGFTSQGKRKAFESESDIIFQAISIFLMARQRNSEIKFIFENVATMGKGCKTKIDELIGVPGVYVDSKCYSAQARRRILWTNINFKNRKEPCESYFIGEAWSKSTRYKDNITGVVYSSPGMGRTPYIEERLRTDRKANTLVTGAGCRGPSTANMIDGRLLTVRECADLQGLSRYKFNCSDAQAFKQIGMGWQVDTFAQIFREGLK